jgi:hypothetical protein
MSVSNAVLRNSSGLKHENPHFIHIHFAKKCPPFHREPEKKKIIISFIIEKIQIGYLTPKGAK